MHLGIHHSAWSLPVTFVIATLALLYLRGWYLMQRALRSTIPAWRLAAFVSGLLAVEGAIGSPLARLDHELLTAHMLQHLVLMTVAAPLILIGSPAAILTYALPSSFIAKAIRTIENYTRRFRIIGNPGFCWLSGTAVVIWWHIPFVFDLGMRSEALHSLEQWSFFVAGLFFWWPVVQSRPGLSRWPRWSVPLYLFLATLPCDALSAFLTFCGHPVYRSYFSGSGSTDVAALQDQARAGALMWVWVTFAYVGPAAAITIQLLSPRVRVSEVEVV